MNVTQTPSTKRRWTQETVISTIQRYAKDSLPLNAQSVIDTDGGLWAAARRLFGSWNAALQAAKIDPATVKPISHRRPPGYWSPTRVIENIHQYTRQGCRLNAHNMQKIDNSLVSAAVYYFGTWSQALEESGIDANDVRRTQQRTSAQVSHEIAQAHLAGADLSDQSVRHWNGGLYGSAQTHFKSWRAAIESAGIDYSTISHNPTWNKTRIRRLTLEFLANGLPVEECFRCHHHLQSAVAREWGNIGEFLQDIGLSSPEQGDARLPELGKALADWRKERGYSIDQFSQKTGLPAEVLHTYEKGLTAIPFLNAIRLAKALNLTLDTLVQMV